MKKGRKNSYKHAGIFIYCIIVMLPLAGAILQQRDTVSFSFGWRQLTLMGNSLKLAVLAVLAALLAGFFCALFLSTTERIKGWSRFYFVLLLPVPFYIYGLSWMYLTRFASSMWSAQSVQTMNGLGASVFVEAFAFSPVATLFMLLGLENVNEEELCLASLYGKDNQAVWRLLLKSVVPYGAVAAGLLSTLSLTDFSVPSMFQYNTYALDLFSIYSRTGSALTAYIQCIPLALILVIPGWWIVNNISRFAVRRTEKKRYRLKTTGIVRGLCIGFFGLSVIQTVGPTLCFFVMAGGFRSLYTAVSIIFPEVAVSVELAFIGTFFCLLLSLLPVSYLKWNPGRVIWIVLCSMVVPGTIQSMGLLKIVNLLGLVSFEKSIGLAALGCALKFLPFMVLIFCMVQTRADRQGMALAELYARNVWSCFWLKIRLVLPAYTAGSLVVFFLIFAEEGIPLILMAPGKETVTVKIYNYLHYGAAEQVAAFSLISLLLIFGIELLLIGICKAFGGNRKHD